MEIIFLFIVFAAIAIIAGIYSHRRKQERIEKLSAWARSLNLYFEPERVRGFDKQHPELGCLRNGSNRYAFNIVSGRRGECEMTAFDYHYETKDSEGDATHHYFSAVLLQPDFQMQPLLIRREGFFDRIKAGFGFKDINFESAEFSKRFYVTAQDKRWAYDVINTRTMQLLLDQMGDRSIECDHQVLCIESGGQLEPYEFEQAYRFGAAVLGGIPDYARRQATV